MRAEVRFERVALAALPAPARVAVMHDDTRRALQALARAGAIATTCDGSCMTGCEGHGGEWRAAHTDTHLVWQFHLSDAEPA